MALILLVLILAILFGGLGFVLHALWWVAAIVLVVWLVGFAAGPARDAAGTAGNSPPSPKTPANHKHSPRPVGTRDPGAGGPFHARDQGQRQDAPERQRLTLEASAGTRRGPQALDSQRPMSDQELVRVDRLGDVVARARGQALVAVARHRLRGDRDDRQRPRGGHLPDLGRRRVAVHLRHHHIHQDQIDLAVRAQGLDAPAAVGACSTWIRAVPGCR